MLLHDKPTSSAKLFDMPFRFVGLVSYRKKQAFPVGHQITPNLKTAT